MYAQDQSRADFERELIANRQFKPSDFCFIDGAYTGDDDVQFAWDVWQAARALPAGMEPAFHARGRTALTPGMSWEVCEPSANSTPAYTAAQVQAMLAQGLAPGWQAVPVEPTVEMLASAIEQCGLSGARLYRVMLAAAPRPPAAKGDMGIPIAATQELVVGPCGQCKDDRQPCSCAIDTMLKARGLIAVNRERYLSQTKLAKAAQQRKPLTPERIRQIDDETHFHESPDWPERFARGIEAAHDIGEAPAAPTACGAESAMSGPLPVTTGAGSVTPGPAPAYRLLQRGVDTIQATDEFLADDGVTWEAVGRGIFVGMTYIGGMLPARRVIETGP